MSAAKLKDLPVLKIDTIKKGSKSSRKVEEAKPFKEESIS